MDVSFFSRDDALRETLEKLPALRKEGPVPLWVQLKNVLATTLSSPVVVPDTRLPSEAELCKIFGVSRPIVRLALDALTSAQLITRVARQGAFVAQRKLDADFASLNTGLFGEMAAKGHKIETRILEMLRTKPTETERARLRLPPRSDVFRVRRVYSLDGIPTAVTLLVLAGHKVEGIERYVRNNRSVYGILRDHYGLEISSSERWFEAILTTAEQAGLLEIPFPSPGLNIESIGFTKDGTPLEYYHTFYNTSHTRIHVISDSGAIVQQVG